MRVLGRVHDGGCYLAQVPVDGSVWILGRVHSGGCYLAQVLGGGSVGVLGRVHGGGRVFRQQLCQEYRQAVSLPARSSSHTNLERGQKKSNVKRHEMGYVNVFTGRFSKVF